jgi:hypothetical protein
MKSDPMSAACRSSFEVADRIALKSNDGAQFSTISAGLFHFGVGGWGVGLLTPAEAFSPNDLSFNS